MWKARILLALMVVSLATLLFFFAREIPANRQSVAAVGDSLLTTGTAATTTSGIIGALQQLQVEDQSLEGELADLRSQVAAQNTRSLFPRTLQRGATGDDVKALQAFLGNPSGTANSTTTGFYGDTTVKAVQTFQAQVGLPGTGVFDARTRDKLVALIQAQSGTATTSTAFVPVDLSAIADPEQDIQSLQNQILQISSQLSTTEAALTDTQSQLESAQSTLASLQNQTTSLGLQVSTAQPATQSLAIASIGVTNIAKTSVSIVWSTNNPATSEVDYSTNSSMPVSSTVIASSSVMATGHTLTLSPLVTATTYYFHIISKDSTGTVSNSSNLSFTTH